MNLRLAAVAVLFGAALSGAAPPTVTIDVNTSVVDRFMGLGVQWDPYEYPPPDAEWKLTLARLDFMKPAFLRVMWRADGYWLGFDADGKPQYVWDRSEAEIKKRLTPLFRILDYAQARNIDVMLGEWDVPHGLTTPGDPRWAQMITGFVKFLTTRKKYTVIRYYNFFNEPNGNWMWPHGKVDYAAWAAGMRLLRQDFDAAGLQSLPIAGPDNSGNWDWLDRCARELRPQIGFWEMHWYAKDQELLAGDVEKLLRAKREMLLQTDPEALSKGIYMGEAGIITGRVNGDQQPRVKTFAYGVLMADYVAQTARAGWMGASAWDLDDALHIVNGRKHPAIPDDLTLKIWGFWNTQGRAMGHPEDESLRPWFYTWSMMSRLFPKGARIVAARETDFPVGLRTVAATGPQGLSVMLVNDAAAPQTVDVRLPGNKFTQYDYFEGDRPVDRSGFPAPLRKAAKVDSNGAVKILLPSRGVVFLTATPR